jgi:hypothetical protein
LAVAPACRGSLGRAAFSCVSGGFELRSAGRSEAGNPGGKSTAGERN